MLKSLKVLKFLTAVTVFILLAFAAYKTNNGIENEAMSKNIMLTSFQLGRPVSKAKNFSKLTQVQKDYTVINDINLFIEGNSIAAKDSILCRNNRYYFSTASFEKILGMTVVITDDGFSVLKAANSPDNTVQAQTERQFIHTFITHNDIPYLSMIDITEGLGLKLSWNYESNTLRFYRLRSEVGPRNRHQRKKPALIRFEDVTAGLSLAKSDNLQKMRIIADLMYSKNLPFHIAWVPRYKKPEANIDNDLLNNYSLSNVDFIYTLDYMIAKGGIVGLHGYTHQNGNEESCIGTEFGYKSYFTREYTQSRVEAAINTAKELDIPFKFFESPHYTSSKEQQAVFESYFDYIYEPAKYLFNTIPVVSKGNGRTVYVPTPIGYVRGQNAEDITKRIKANPKDYIASLFYHPYKEFDHIKLINQDDYPEFEYSDASILKQILECLDSEGYSPVKITDIEI
jgi:hypothetical protein